MKVFIVTKSEMHTDSIYKVCASKADAEKCAAEMDAKDEKASYYVEEHEVMPPTDRIERMGIEESELKDRIRKLVAFMESDEFGKLDDTEKRLLRMQYAGMDAYLSALGSRLAYDGLKRYQAEAQEFCKRIPELQAAGKTDKEIGDMMPQLNLDTSKAFPSLLFYSLIAAAANDN